MVSGSRGADNGVNKANGLSYRAQLNLEKAMKIVKKAPKTDLIRQTILQARLEAAYAILELIREDT